MLKNIEILKIHLSQTGFVIRFSANPKNMRVKLRHFMMFSLTVSLYIWLLLRLESSLLGLIFKVVLSKLLTASGILKPADLH